MNPKKSGRKRGRPKGRKVKAEEGVEVFVLPPHLLQKLGIDIANITIPQEVQPNNADGNDLAVIPNSPKSNNQIKQNLSITSSQNGENVNSTIIETASLMKQSVLLSPTFNSDDTNLPDELAVAHVDNELQLCSNFKENVDKNSMNINHDTKEKDEIFESSVLKFDFVEKIIKKACENNVDIVDNSKSQLNDSNVFVETVPSIKLQDSEYVEEVLKITDGVLPLEDHPDEAYSSDCSNSNPELVENKINDAIKESNRHNKINIISEQILSPSQFKELKCLHNKNSQGSHFFPISLNTSIASNKNVESLNKETNLSASNNILNSESILFFDDKGLKINSENCNEKNGLDYPVYTNMNESLTFEERYKVAEKILGGSENTVGVNAENSFEVCIDFNESDIEKHLEDNEEILENFVNEINGSETHKIIEKLEKSENVCSQHMIKITENQDDAIFSAVEATQPHKDGTLSVFNNNNEDYLSAINDEIEEKNKLVTTSKFDVILDNNNLVSNEPHVGDANNQTSNDTELITEKQILHGYDNLPVNNEIHMDKVGEIASLLRSFTRAQSINPLCKKMFFHKYSRKPKSKEHVQGVEKPGGSNLVEVKDKTSKIGLKTYRRSTKPKNMPTLTTNIQKTDDNTKIDLPTRGESSTFTQENTIIGIKTNFPKTNNFCLCQDFGSFTFYNDKIPYEHIHFLDHTNIVCESKLLFSIYSDENVEKVEFDKSIEDESSPDCKFSICWNEALHDKLIDTQKLFAAEETCTTISSLSDVMKEKFEPYQGDSVTIANFGVEENITDTPSTENSGKISGKDIVNIDTPVISNTESCERYSSNPSFCNTEVESNNEEDSIIVLKIVEDVTDQMTNNSEENSTQASETHKSDSPTFAIISSCDGVMQSETHEEPNIVIIEEDATDQIINSSTVNLKVSDSGECSKPDCSSLLGSVNMMQSNDDIISEAAEDSIKNVTTTGNVELQNDCSSVITKLSEATNPKNILNEQSLPMDVEMDGTRCLDMSIDNKVCDALAPADTTTPSVTTEETVVKQKSKRGRKRKNNAVVEENKPNTSEGKDEPPIKKSIKCGVCQELLNEENWDAHCDTSHCFIAWKEGESLDLQNTELTKKLQNRLKGNNLKCPYCEFENRRVKKFLAHVGLCMTSKKSTDATENVPDPNSGKEDEVSLAEIKKVKNEVKCGVCQEKLNNANWIEHIAQKHNYLSWQDGESPLDLEDKKAIRKHLNNIAKEVGKLFCSKCSFSERNIKHYLNHVESCNGSKDNLANNTDKIDNKEEQEEELSENNRKKKKRKSKVSWFICAVCSKNIEEPEWIEHIAREHSYLAWKVGEEPLDINNEEVVKRHLGEIVTQYGALVCHRCAATRKSVKVFINHVKKCGAQMIFNTNPQAEDKCKEEFTIDPAPKNIDTSTNENKSSKKKAKRKSTQNEEDVMVECALCKEKTTQKYWIEHIERKHEYLAWKEGDEPINFDNKEELYNHLHEVSWKNSGLKCLKCGLIRKYVKPYLHHKEACNAIKIEKTDSAPGESVSCGVCSEIINPDAWKSHAMSNHYNVAWRSIDPPIDMNNPGVAERLMKEYREKNKLICKTCNASRASLIGFYAHILTCGKSDEEAAQFKTTCEICNKQYLKIYNQQHMAAHNIAEKNRELKKIMADKEEDHESKPERETNVSGQRKAALKARTVIEKYKASISSHGCSCGIDPNNEAEMANHKCTKNEPFSDSEESAKFGSGEESSESEVDSNISENEFNETALRKRKHKSAASLIKRLPFAVKNPNAYATTSGREFCKYHFTEENLFPDLYNLDLMPVPEDELPNYLPTLEQSCQVQFEGPWETYKRFEAKRGTGYSLFTGASIQTLSWVPNPLSESTVHQYLTIVCHNGADAPRLEVDETPSGPGLIQIWSFGKFTSLPTFVFGLAHDLGTIWAIDWCPSGAQDSNPTTTISRLGLLAVASSNGSGYVFSIPDPCTIENRENVFYKMEPILELRLSMMNGTKKFQATSIKWSPQKGHSVIVVGYGDGTTAYYDLHSDSPLLKTKENNRIVVYPYHDERSHNHCVLGLTAYPSMNTKAPMGAVCTVSLTGCEMVSRGTEAPVKVRAKVPASGASFLPLWPATMLTGDDSVVNGGLNEMQWWCCPRRVFSTMANATCVHCSKVAYFGQPLLRVTYAHPAFDNPRRITIGSIAVAPLSSKRKKTTNDDLTIKLEPNDYDDAITKYGLQFTLDHTLTPASHVTKEIFPERFPLADVRALSFCPSPSYHSKLAVGTHAGIVFLVTV